MTALYWLSRPTISPQHSLLINYGMDYDGVCFIVGLRKETGLGVSVSMSFRKAE